MTTRATALSTCCSLSVIVFGAPAQSALQQSTSDVTKACLKSYFVIILRESARIPQLVPRSQQAQAQVTAKTTRRRFRSAVMPRQADSDHLERAYGDTTLFIVLSISRRHNNEQPPGKILSVSYFISFHVIYYVIKQSRQTSEYHISMILPSSYLFTCGGNNSSYTIF